MIRSSSKVSYLSIHLPIITPCSPRPYYSSLHHTKGSFSFFLPKTHLLSPSIILSCYNSYFRPPKTHFNQHKTTLTSFLASHDKYTQNHQWQKKCHNPNSGQPKIWPMTLSQKFDPKGSLLHISSQPKHSEFFFSTYKPH